VAGTTGSETHVPLKMLKSNINLIGVSILAGNNKSAELERKSGKSYEIGIGAIHLKRADILSQEWKPNYASTLLPLDPLIPFSHTRNPCPECLKILELDIQTGLSDL
jgi:hypothetical protein